MNHEKVRRVIAAYQEWGRALRAVSEAFRELDTARPPGNPIAGLQRLGHILAPPPACPEPTRED